MTDLRGIARRLHLSIEQIRVVADLLEQGYQPSFIERYRADETGNLPRGVLWALKLEVDRQQRLAESREKATSQLPKDASLDEEATSFLASSLTEAEMEMAMRSWRARRNHAQAPQRDVEAEQLLEKMIAHSGEATQAEGWVASELNLAPEAASELLERTQRLVGTLISGDTSLALKLRKALQKNAKLKVQYIEDSQADGDDSENADSENADASSDTSDQADKVNESDTATTAQDSSQVDASASSEGSSAVEPASEQTATSEVTQTSEVTLSSPAEGGDLNANDSSESTESASDQSTPGETILPATDNSSDAAAPKPDDVGNVSADSETGSTAASAEPSNASTEDQPASGDTTGNAVDDSSDSSVESPVASAEQADTESTESKTETESNSADVTSESTTSELTFSKRGKKDKAKPKKTSKSIGKLTPRQRRRRWLLTMIQSMKSLKRSIGDLTAFQQLMLGKARRSQIIKTNLQYDDHVLTAPARDMFVSKQHPFSKWFERAVKEALDHSLRSKIEIDALTHLEEMAQEKLLETSTTRLRQTLMQRPVRGHVVMVVDTVGPNSASVAVVGPGGGVLHTDEVACSAKPEAISRNVIHLGEIAHRFRVTLVALTNGPARRFLVLTLKELMKQSADSGLRWTMADRGGADAYAVGRVALRELPAHNRRDRAAIWVARCLQDPLNELLKLDVNRLRLGSFQRELPQEPLKKLVRETIADCVCSRGIDTHYANVEGLKSIAGVGEDEALQIVELASKGELKSRQQLLADVKEWPEKESRQAIGFLRVFGSEQPLDATLIHPDDYRLADRLISNTELEMPENAPPNWRPPEKEAERKEAEGKAQQEQIADDSASADVGTGDSATAGEPESQDATAEETASSLEQTETPTGSGTDESAADAATEKVASAAEGDGDATAEGDQQEAAQSDAAQSDAATETSSADATASEDSDPQNSDAEHSAEGEPTGDDESSSSTEATSTTGEKLTEVTDASSDNLLDELGGKPEYSDEVAATQQKETPAAKIDIEKHARGWQVGREKLRWVANCLQDPFGDPRLSYTPVPMLRELPSLSELKPGTCLWAVVVGVADFGAFVELAPECSGLIHISRLSSDYVEDPHQVVQVGDLLMVWVVSVDESKNRVALTALSPEQRAEQEHSSSGRGGRGQGERGGGKRYAGRGSEGGDNRGRGHGGSQNRGSQGRGGQGQGRGGGRDGGQGRGGKPGGRGGKSFGGRHGKGRGQGGPKQPKTVVVKSKKPVDPISSAMKEGDEPLRSFSDLMQFYEAKRTDDVPPPKTEVTPKSTNANSGADAGETSAKPADESVVEKVAANQSAETTTPPAANVTENAGGESVPKVPASTVAETSQTDMTPPEGNSDAKPASED